MIYMIFQCLFCCQNFGEIDVGRQTNSLAWNSFWNLQKRPNIGERHRDERHGGRTNHIRLAKSGLGTSRRKYKKKTAKIVFG